MESQKHEKLSKGIHRNRKTHVWLTVLLTKISII